MIIPNNDLLRLIDRIQTRVELTKRDINLFFPIYFLSHIKYPSAPFHRDICNVLQSEDIKLACIVAFRGSAKSTLCSLVYPLWCALGDPSKKYIVIVCQTQTRAQETLENIRRELVYNQRLISDFGPIREQSDPNNNAAIILGRYGVKITAVSISEGLRGARFGHKRPDLIICDDIEDVQSSKTKESRDKTWQLINSEIIPLGDLDTKIIFVGNLIHSDSAIMRLKKEIGSGKIKGIFTEIPLLDENNQPAWAGKFPSQKEIDELRGKIGSEIDFQREYMLKIIPEGDQVVLPEWIKSYKSFPNQGLHYCLIGVDPAFSETQTADKTAIITAQIFGSGKEAKLYICPHPFNKQKRQPVVIEEIKQIYEAFGRYTTRKVLVEKAGQQIGLIDSIEAEGLPVEGIPIGGQDKRARLSVASHYIKTGQILFPEKGAEELINQILYFGTERYDDLVDAFTILTYYFIEILRKPEPRIDFI